MSRNVFFSFISLASRLAGAKVTILFVLARLLKSFFEKYFFAFFSSFLSVFQGTLLVLRGANVTSVFESHKLFSTFFENKFSSSGL